MSITILRFKKVGLGMKYTLNISTFIALFQNSLNMVNAYPIPAFEEFSDKDINEMLAKQFPIEKLDLSKISHIVDKISIYSLHVVRIRLHCRQCSVRPIRLNAKIQ